jgi:hypothetical protein
MGIGPAYLGPFAKPLDISGQDTPVNVLICDLVIARFLAEMRGENNDDETATLAEQCPKCARQSG